MVKLFGDPHIGSSSTDHELFEYHFTQLDPTKGVYGVLIGDYFDNWRGVLAKLLANEPEKSLAWTFFEYLMRQHGEGVLAGILGNHDLWIDSPVDPVSALFEEMGALMRSGRLRM